MTVYPEQANVPRMDLSRGIYPPSVRDHVDLGRNAWRLFEACRFKKRVVELGSRCGHGAAIILDSLGPDGELHSIDVKYKLNDPDFPVPTLNLDDPRWTRHVGSSLDGRLRRAIGPVDVVFIDTTHTLEQTAVELQLWGDTPRIVLHDMELDGVWVAAMRCAISTQRSLSYFPGEYGWGEIV